MKFHIAWHLRFGWVLAGLLCLSTPAPALLFYNLGNDDAVITQAPSLTYSNLNFEFDAVARVSSVQSPTKLSDIGGSAIHLGNGYMLTANHVTLSAGHEVTFNGTDFYQVDGGFAITQVAPGVDLKVFKLYQVPAGISSVVLHTAGSENMGDAFLVGWGVGRNTVASPLGSSSVQWGDWSTSRKRWGVNQPEDLSNLPGYDSVRTTLGTPTATPPGIGDYETAVTLLDSGSALFQFIDSTWQLIGVATSVEAGGTSVFGTDVPLSGDSHDNYFAQISTYASQIEAIVIPEMSSVFLAGLFLLVFGVACYRRNRP